MADREQAHRASSGMTEKPRRDTADKMDWMREGEQHRTDLQPGGTVGRTVPDESKEHHTDIAIEAGRRAGERRDNNR
jgi:hypothetical protein